METSSTVYTFLQVALVEAFNLRISVFSSVKLE